MLAILTVGMLLVAVYCLVPAVRDLRRRAYVMAGCGVACAVLILAIMSVPIATHAVSVTLPINDAR